MIRYSRACHSYQDFLDRGLLLTMKLLNQGFHWWSWSHHFENLTSSPWLGWPLWNICVTNDHGIVLIVVNTSRSFPHSRCITEFVTKLTRRVPLVEQELLILPEHLSSPPVLVGFAYDEGYSRNALCTLNLISTFYYLILSFICMLCRSLFVHLYFFFWPLCCLFFFDIRILIAPLVSSNSSWICSVSLEICRKHQIYKDGYWLLTCFQYELRSLCEHMGSPPSLVGSVRGINLFSCVCCLSSACVLCTQYGKFLRIVHSSLFLRFSLTFT